MKAIVGLGNPDVKYKNTRHNIGFMVLDEILKNKNLILKEKFKGFFAKDENNFYLLPLTYMNLSGNAVIELVNFYKINPQDLLVIFDDATLPLGTLRFRSEGSDGGHNGMKSIIKALGTDKIPRLKVGVGLIPPNIPIDVAKRSVGCDEFFEYNEWTEEKQKYFNDFVGFNKVTVRSEEHTSELQSRI